MRILHVNASDIIGGAARAAYRIHRSLVECGHSHGLQSTMRVTNKHSDDCTVIGGSSKVKASILCRVQTRLERRWSRKFVTGNPVCHSIASPGNGLGRELQILHSNGEIDLVHLHWLGDITLSIEAIGRLNMPLVWTLHDQWAFCGAEHYTTPPQVGESASTDDRFVLGYTPASRPKQESGPDLNRRTWLRKRTAWRRPIHIVATTTWLADCARRSALMATWPISVVPYPIDLKLWAPVDQRQARALLQLPQDRPLVLFGAIGGTVDPRKGADLLLSAMKRLHCEVSGTPLEQLELVIFGQGRPAQQPKLGFPIHYFGRLHDDVSSRLLYAASDVMVVPSRQEAFGQTASEAQACGTPVVAFRTGGLVDVIDDDHTGKLAEPFDIVSLALSIRSILINPAQRRSMGEMARMRALELWEPSKISSLYASVYAEAATMHQPQAVL